MINDSFKKINKYFIKVSKLTQKTFLKHEILKFITN